MRFMMLYKPGKEDVPPTPEHIAEMGRYIEKLSKAGVLLALDGLHPPSMGVRVSFSGGKPKVTDGPFAEAKEVLGGYWMIQVKSKEEAIEHAKDFLALVGGGESEVRQMHDAGDFAPQ